MSASLIADPDLSLIRQAQAGDMEAFDQIVLRHQSTMTALLHRFVHTRADLEDLVQETFVKAWRGLPAWEPEKPFVHWLKRIAVRCGLEFYRRQQRSPLSRLAQPTADGRDPLDDLPADTLEADQQRGALGEAQFLLSHLQAEDRALLTLLHLEQMPLAEIAQHFGWTRINAKVKAFRARQRLKTLLKRHGYELT
ncbi:MAG: RNA polymerase sigma factor [Prosthecobacter sp.]|nr:RNA polymerase sigma factor [Prosthecobacter sp.]